MTFLSQDRDLLLAFRAGDPAALTRVYWAYVNDVQAWIRRCPGLDADTVAELVQETFIRALSAAARNAYDGLRPFRAYLRRIVHNLLVDRARRRNMAPFELDEDQLDHGAEHVELEQSLAERQLRAQARAYVDSLDEETRTFVRLRFDEEHSQEQTALKMAVSRRRVRTLEDRVRGGLLKHLRDAGLAEQL